MLRKNTYRPGWRRKSFSTRLALQWINRPKQLFERTPRPSFLRMARHSAGIRSDLQNAVYGSQFSLMLLSFRLAAFLRRSPQVVRLSSSQYAFKTR